MFLRNGMGAVIAVQDQNTNVDNSLLQSAESR